MKTNDGLINYIQIWLKELSAKLLLKSNNAHNFILQYGFLFLGFITILLGMLIAVINMCCLISYLVFKSQLLILFKIISLPFSCLLKEYLTQ